MSGTTDLTDWFGVEFTAGDVLDDEELAEDYRKWGGRPTRKASAAASDDEPPYV